MSKNRMLILSRASINQEKDDEWYKNLMSMTTLIPPPTTNHAPPAFTDNQLDRLLDDVQSADNAMACTKDVELTDQLDQLTIQHVEVLGKLVKTLSHAGKLSDDNKLLNEERVKSAIAHAHAVKYLREQMVALTAAAEDHRQSAANWRTFAKYASGFAVMLGVGFIAMLFINASH